MRPCFPECGCGYQRTRRPERLRAAMLFTFDALLASLLLIAALAIILYAPREAPPATQSTHYAQDTLLALSAIEVGELNDPWVATLIANGSIDDPSRSLIEQIGTFWATNRSQLAENLSLLVVEELLPEEYGVALSFGNDMLYERALAAEERHRSVARRMVTGIQKGEVLEGSTSTAYLKRIKDKGSYAIAYFGGFVGQGNITLQLGPLPEELESEDITGIQVQMDTVDDFFLEINGDPCMLLDSDETLMTVQSWDLLACNGSINSGTNNVTLLQQGDLGEAYVAGGFIKVDYLTDAFNEWSNASRERYEFPVIEGLINLYDSVSVPGYVTDWYLNLSFWSNYTVFMRLGNQTLFSLPGSADVQNVVLEAHNLTWSPTTVPLRLGTTNFTNVTIIQDGEPGDTVLVTDVSGSMDACVEWETTNYCTYDCCRWTFLGYWCPGWFTFECPDPGSCSGDECGSCGAGWTEDNHDWDPQTECGRDRLEIAQDADKLAVETILNTTGNEVGLVSYDERVRDYLDLTSDQNALETQIDGYYAEDGTCICCGINRAKNLLKDSPDKTFMIVMSDGDANYKCDDFNDYVGTYDDDDDSHQSTIDAGQNACSNHNITVFTVGFGSGMSAQGRQTLRETACNESLYFDALNESDLEQIYANISDLIGLEINFTAQTVIINGTYVTSDLLPGSYLDLVYTPLDEEPGQNEIEVKLETPQFSNCTTTWDIPSGLDVREAVVTSYSGPYWTSYLSVNGLPAFNLTEYSDDYGLVGDPFRVSIPIDLLNLSGGNALTLTIADNDRNTTNCSSNNTIFYSGAINSTVPRSTVLESDEGCHWSIEFEDGHFLNVTIPVSYSGEKNCTYTSGDIDYDPEDAYDVGVFRLLDQIDFDKDGRVFVNIEAADLEIIVTVVTRVPYLWGPSFATLEVWR